MSQSMCTVCNVLKPTLEFYSTQVCKKCNNKLHYRAHREYYLKKRKARRSVPEKNRQDREYNTTWTKRRRAESIEVRIKGNLRNRLRDAIKGRRKSATTIQLLGCSWNEYKTYIESRWVNGMSWENYGRGDGHWNIDHIKPLAAFNLTLETEQADAFHYKNTQPMWEIDNFRKGSRMT